jgi:hypothetical protein
MRPCARSWPNLLIAILACSTPARAAPPTVEVDVQGYDLELQRPAATLEAPVCGVVVSAAPARDGADGLAGDLWLQPTAPSTVLRRVVSAGEAADAPLEPGDVYVATCAAQRTRISVREVDGVAGLARLQLEPLALP